MGYFSSLWKRAVYGKGADWLERLSREIALNATHQMSPIDRDLWKLAEETKGHISLKAVQDEYDRLVAEDLDRPARPAPT